LPYYEPFFTEENDKKTSIVDKKGPKPIKLVWGRVVFTAAKNRFSSHPLYLAHWSAWPLVSTFGPKAHSN
jgi:hypothetical protein